MPKPRFTDKKAEVHIGTIVLLIIALLVIVAVVMGTGTVTDFFKEIFDLLGAKHKNAQICDNYKVIKGEQDMLDIIYYVKKGYCGGDRNDDPFIFTIDTTPSTDMGVKFTVGPKADGSCGPPYFCGGHSCYLTAYAEAPETNPVYLQFGDVEKATGMECKYAEDWWESQECIGSDKSDLVLSGISGVGESTTYPCDYATTQAWCVETEGVLTSNTVKSFVLKNLTNPLTDGYNTWRGTWGIRREGEDVVICLMLKKVS